MHKFQTNSSCVISICCCSVDKSCPTLSNPMNYSMSLTISWSLPKFMSIESVMQPTISSSVALFSFFLQSFPASGSFPMNQLFTSGGQNIGASASASVLPRSMQCWFPLRLTDFISLPFKEAQESSPAPQFKSINTLALGLLYSPPLTSVHDYWKTITLTIRTFVGKVMALLFNKLSRFVIAFLTRRKQLQISWPQSPWQWF